MFYYKVKNWGRGGGSMPVSFLQLCSCFIYPSSTFFTNESKDNELIGSQPPTAATVTADRITLYYSYAVIHFRGVHHVDCVHYGGVVDLIIIIRMEFFPSL